MAPASTAALGAGCTRVLYAHEADNTKLFPSLRPGLASALSHGTGTRGYGSWRAPAPGEGVGGMVTGREAAAGKAGVLQPSTGQGWGSVCGQACKCWCAWTHVETQGHTDTRGCVGLQTAAVEVHTAHQHLQLYLHKATERLHTCTHVRLLQGCLQTHTHTQSHTRTDVALPPPPSLTSVSERSIRTCM